MGLGRLLVGLVASLIALAAFTTVVYGLPVAGALAALAGPAVTIAVLLAHLWARERREARG